MNIKPLMTCALLSVFLASFGLQSAFAGPFGIDMGMSLAEVRQVCRTGPVTVENDDDLYMITPLKTNDLFHAYKVRIDPEHGVYWIAAAGRDIYSADYGPELISTFDGLVSYMEETYGSYKKTDIGQEYRPEYFMRYLREGHRVLAAAWAAKYNSKLPGDISEILVEARSRVSNFGCVILEYWFSNREKIKSKLTLKEKLDLKKILEKKIREIDMRYRKQ